MQRQPVQLPTARVDEADASEGHRAQGAPGRWGESGEMGPGDCWVLHGLFAGPRRADEGPERTRADGGPPVGCGWRRQTMGGGRGRRRLVGDELIRSGRMRLCGRR